MAYSEPFRIKTVEKIYQSTEEERRKWIEESHLNMFYLRSDQVAIDLLSDSGTGAMSCDQWAELMMGDEAYAGSASYFKLEKAVKDVFGMPYFLPAHQGRGAENVLFATILQKGDMVLNNVHFDSTKAHIEYRNAIAKNCVIAESKMDDVYHPFKGNVDTEELEQILKENENVKLIFVTITCNNIGGQPVSIGNMREVYKIAQKFNIPVCYDAARYAENAYFVKTRESEFSDHSIREILQEMFRYCDLMVVSCKKDALANTGGFLAFRSEELYERAKVYESFFEGLHSYGGLSGRDMGAMSVGIYESLDFDFLRSRNRQLEFLARKLEQNGIPFMKPVGGHAIFINAGKFLPKVPVLEFPGQTLAVELYIRSGVRGLEFGSLPSGRDPKTGLNRIADAEYLRLCVPRRTYTDNHLNVVAESLISLYKERDSIKTGLEIVYEAPIMRYPTVRLKRVEDKK
ncbi:putative beta-eliminating lyase [Convolutriloba macropyga]|uniref:putative beta-eliminating lyase n=1 Tax=Convolutriloba macropyga TaxID=536237 RepID=UPI003F51BAC6